MLDKIASGETLKSWIRTIELKLGNTPKVSEFVEEDEKKESMCEKLVSTLTRNSEKFIKGTQILI